MNFFLRFWCHLDTLTRKNIIFKKTLPTPVNSTVQMNVVIPRREYSAIFKVFLIPRDGYELFDHDVWGQETSDDSFQISKTKFHKRSTFSEQLLKIVEKIAKTIVFETKKLRFLANFSRFLNIFCWVDVDPTWNLVLESWKGSSEVCFSSISWSKTS